MLVACTVHLANGIESPPTHLAIEPRRIAEIEDRVTIRPALNPLVDTRKESGPPERFSAIRRLTAGEENDETGQIFVDGAQTIVYPRTHRRIAKSC